MTLFSDLDSRIMARVCELASQGIGQTSPNPCVGAVVTDATGAQIGAGTHLYERLKHAEVLALEQAGEKARGGTLYLSLEPCCHQGRTGPCTDLVLSSGVKRVVLAMQDPNPKVCGKGIKKLRDGGIEVEVASPETEIAQRARKLNESFARYILWELPLVTLKAGMTLDGKIAPPPGESSDNPSALGSMSASGGWITSEEARAHVHLLRHASDAIMVGVGTIIADDPLLTDRSGKPRRRRLLRVILDSRLRLPVDSRVVKTAEDDVIVFCAFAEEKRRRELEARGIRVEQLPLFPVQDRYVVGGAPVPSADGRPDIRALVRWLGEQEITSLLVEGGALVNWAALAAGVVDKVFLYYAPKILAGTGAVPFATGAGFRHMNEAAQVKSITLHRFGEDFAVEGYLRDPYEPQAQPKAESGPQLIYEGV